MNGILMNYYFHCKRQCYLFGNKLNLEDNSEEVKIGRALHEEKAENGHNTEIAIENIKLDKLTSEYLTEIKKSDADEEACKWQLLYYLWVLKQKGIFRKGKLEFIEKNKQSKKVLIYELNEEYEACIKQYIADIELLLKQEDIPPVTEKKHCKRCAYYEYCFI